MKREKRNVEKDQYRVKPYTPKYSKPCKKKRSLAHLEQIKGLFKIESIGKTDIGPECLEIRKINEVRENIPYLCRMIPQLNFLLDIAYKGANLDTIHKALNRILDLWYEKTGTYNLLLNKGPEYIGKEKAIKNALTTLCKLQPVLPEFKEGQLINAALAEMQGKLNEYKALIDRYLDLLLFDMHFDKSKGLDLSNLDPLFKKLLEREYYEIVDRDFYLNVLMEIYPPEKIRGWLLKKSKPLTQSTHNIWNESKGILFDEFYRIGYSIKSAQRKTAELLNLFFPDIYKDKDPDLVKIRW